MKNYVEESVKWRMGKWYDEPFFQDEHDWSDSKRLGYISKRCWRDNAKVDSRYRTWLERWKDLGIDKNIGVILDSQDNFDTHDIIIAEDFYKAVSHIPSVPRQNFIPWFSKCRRAYSNESILTTNYAPYYKETFINDDCFVYSWEDMINECYWRGKFTGKIPCVATRNKKYYFQQSPEFCKDLKDSLEKYIRYKIVLDHKEKHDIKFCPKWSCWMLEDDEIPWKETVNPSLYDIIYENLSMISDILKEKNMIDDEQRDFEKEVCKRKYLLCLDGNDTASQLTKSLKSPNLILAPPMKWHCTLHFKLRPWEHYVPLKENGVDLDEKVDWCRKNDNECKKISERASEYISNFTKDSEDMIEKRIFEVLKQNAK
jgi:hypothetical protein